MIIRIYYQKLGGHFHCRMFTGKAKNMTFALSGELVFDEREWNDVRDMLHSACEFIEDMPPRNTDISVAHIGGI